MTKPFTRAYALAEAEMAKWDALIAAVRNDVNGVARSRPAPTRRIGKRLEASVTLRASGESKAVLDKISDMNLKELLIVSECLIAEDDAADAARRHRRRLVQSGVDRLRQGGRRHEVPALLDALQGRRPRNRTLPPLQSCFRGALTQSRIHLSLVARFGTLE